MNINPLIFRAYDIRGIADGEYITPDLTPESMYCLGQAVGTYMQKKYGKRIVCGKDNRTTSDALFEAFVSGLLTTGCHVTSIGHATSPLVYFATCYYDDFDGGVNITASHNPKEYNGVKLVAKNAHSICGDELQTILKLCEEENFTVGKGELTQREIFADYIRYVKSVIKKGKPLKIVVDAGNGITGIFAPRLLRELGHEVIELHCELDGTFPNHEANPESEKNLLDVKAKVLETGADLGIGFDGDGDRVGVIDEKGEFKYADYLLIPLARSLLKDYKNAPIIFDIKSSRVVEDDIKAHGGRPIRYKTGHSFIETKMNQMKAPLGGETSGHIFFGDRWFGFDDGMYAACRIIELVSTTGVPFSAQFDGLPEAFTTPEYKVPCADNAKFRVVEDVSKFFVKRYPCITIDGVWVDFGEGAWGAVRASNTSPNLTLRFEARDEKRLKMAKLMLFDKLKEYAEVDLRGVNY